MILKSLYDYYNRCDDLAPEGLEYKELSFIIVIDREGRFVRLEDKRTDKKSSSQFLVAKSVNRTSSPVANVLWDNCSYVLGISDASFPLDNPPEDPAKLRKKEKEREKEVAKNKKNHATFTKKIANLEKVFSWDEGIKAIGKFYAQEASNMSLLEQDPLWEQLRKNLIKNVSFMLDGDTTIVASQQDLLSEIQLMAADDHSDAVKALCLITGHPGPAIESTTPTPIAGGKSNGRLVAFQVNSGYDSYGKKKCYNAPISEKAEFAYSTALNRLLSKDSKNKFYIGTRTYLFWASSNDQTSLDAEESLYSMFGASSEDDPNRKIEQVRKVFNDIFSGIRPTSDDDRFFFLGLAPNAARIAVVYWNECKLKDFAKIILRHFDDMEIIDGRGDDKKKPYQGLHQMLGAVTLDGKSSDVQPNLPDVTIKSMLQGTPYPVTLFQACIRRIKAEQEVTPYNSPCRPAILKAYLNRINDNNKKIEVMLDKQNNNVGYLCGRLFATLEKIQEDANHIHNIRERYLNAASSTPSAVFPTILNLSVHHLEKLSGGQQVFFGKIEQEIIDKLPADGFPAHLDLADQGRFFIGYYHQRQDFFKRKDDGQTEKESDDIK